MANIHTIFSSISHEDRMFGRFFPLYLISLFYSGIVYLRNILYDRDISGKNKVAAKVISIGNITVGGTGKTPAVIMLANLLQGKGYKPAVVSRGYGGKTRKPVNIVSDGKRVLIKSHEAGDEPVLIAKSLIDIPVITGKNRFMAAKYALKRFDIDLVILDDAFQHRSLFRDIDILLLDAKRPFGNGFLIPRGGLREPPGALKRADIVLLSGAEGGRDPSIRGMIEKRCPGRPVFTGYRRPKDLTDGKSGKIFPCEYLRGKKIFAFSGIGNPENFRETVASLGGEIAGTLSFPDHHVYKKEDPVRIKRAASECRAEILLTTGKDQIKLIDFTDFLGDIFILRIEMAIAPPGKFEECILAKLTES